MGRLGNPSSWIATARGAGLAMTIYFASASNTGFSSAGLPPM
jgi:hypothetical protein